MTAQKPDRERTSSCGFLTSWRLGADQVGEGDNVSLLDDRSVQVEGEFWGASVIIEGSNDGEYYQPLTTLDALQAECKEPALMGIREYTRHLRPRVQGGDKHTKVTVSLMGRVTR